MKKNKIGKLTLGSDTIKRLTGDGLAKVHGGEIFTSAIGCPSAFATDCCGVDTLNCSKLCPA